MTKKNKQKLKDFDSAFDNSEVGIDFSQSVKTKGLSKTVKLPPMDIPGWMSAEIEGLAKMQANSKSSIVRQLLIAGLKHKHLL